jgi:hypothetical protein
MGILPLVAFTGILVIITLIFVTAVITLVVVVLVTLVLPWFPRLLFP